MFFKRGKKKQDTVQELKPVYKLSGQNNKIFIIENGTEREITYSEREKLHIVKKLQVSRLKYREIITGCIWNFR